MKWSEEKAGQLKTLAQAGVSNKEIATQLGVSVTDVYAKRSQLCITIDKVKSAVKVNPEFEALFPKTEIEEKCELLRLLEPAIIKADKSVIRLKLIDIGKAVLIIHADGVGTRVDIEADSLLAIIVDVTRKCLY